MNGEHSEPECMEYDVTKGPILGPVSSVIYT